MKSVNAALRFLLLVVAAWLLLPTVWRFLESLMPTVFGLLGLVVVVKLYGKFWQR